MLARPHRKYPLCIHSGRKVNHSICMVPAKMTTLSTKPTVTLSFSRWYAAARAASSASVAASMLSSPVPGAGSTTS